MGSLVLLPLLAACSAPGQTGAGSTRVSFQFERHGLAVPRFTLTVDEAGSAKYEADEVSPAPRGGEAEETPTRHIDRTVTLSGATTRRIFETARALDRFRGACASKMKNIADTGTKTLQYTGADGDGSCTYNFSENKRVVQLSDLFLAIARTLDVGRRLEFQHRFDRLGLDATMTSLSAEVESGSAAELGVIAPTLRSLSEDSELMQRVRQRAVRLMEMAQAPS